MKRVSGLSRRARRTRALTADGLEDVRGRDVEIDGDLIGSLASRETLEDFRCWNTGPDNHGSSECDARVDGNEPWFFVRCRWLQSRERKQSNRKAVRIAVDALQVRQHHVLQCE